MNEGDVCMSDNTLKDDIKVTLSWFKYIPYGKGYEEDLKVFVRLKYYVQYEDSDSE